MDRRSHSDPRVTCYPLPSTGTLSSQPKDFQKSSWQVAGARLQSLTLGGLTPHLGDRPTSHTSDPYIVSAEVALDLGWIHRPPLDQHSARVENFDVFQLRFCLGIWKQPVMWMRACGILRPVQNPPSGWGVGMDLEALWGAGS